MSSSTASIVFASTGILHFLISIGSMVMSCDCVSTLFSGMVYGGLFVPAILLINWMQKAKKSTMVISLVSTTSITLSFAGAIGVKMVYDVCHERLLFMAFIHGFVVPGMIASGIQLVK